MENIKEKLKKYRVIIVLFVTLVASTCIYFYASADEDIYDNQISATINSVDIVDGTEGFDADNEEGNDSASDNKIVRSFDKITYQIKYRLGYKSDSTLTEEQKTTDLDRNVIVDILVPASLDAKVATDDEMNALSPTNITIGENTYKYYTYTYNDKSLSSDNIDMEVLIFDINGKQGDVISPIIRVREATDQVTPIADNVNLEEIVKANVENVTVSAKEAYGVELYGTNPIKNTSSSKIITGVVVYIPSDSAKGIKGVQIPGTVTFNIKAQADVDSTYATIKEGAAIVDYNAEFAANTSEITGMPLAYNVNGNSTVGTPTTEDGNITSFPITISDLIYQTDVATLSDNSQRIYISSKAFTFNNDKTSLVASQKKNIIYTMSATASPSNTVELLDNYDPFVGDYVSTIDFYKLKDSPLPEEHGKAIFNYNENFYIKNTIKYGNDAGDKLPNGVTHYIKVDNTAIELKDYENTAVQNIDYAIKFNSTSGTTNHSIEVKYGLGDWNSTYFKLKESRPSYCPQSMDGLDREQIMNYYGGPCIEETSSVTWVDKISDAINDNKGDKIIIYKLSVLDEVEEGTTITIGLKAQATKNIANVENTYQVVTRAKTTWNSSDYYLSELENGSVYDKSADLDYSKTVYNDGVATGDVSTIGDTTLNNNIGNTILVSAFKSGINDIQLRDVYNASKSTFYSGMTDPIEIEITPSLSKSDFDATFTGATISVYLPKELEIYQKTGDKAYNAQTSGSEVEVYGKQYKVYNYDYTAGDINYENESASGTIPVLLVHAYIDIATQDNTAADVLVRISAKLKPSATASNEFFDITPVEQRQLSQDMLLRNIVEVNTIGKADKTRIEENGSYTYNMRATNASPAPAKLALLYVLPYDGDGVGEGSKFTGSLSVKLASALPSGYTAKYTTEEPKTLLTNEINGTAVQWSDWTNVTTDLTNATAIKIVATNPIGVSQFFGSKNGINLVLTTKGNKEAENYYNNFYMIQYDTDICVYSDITADDCTVQRGNQSFTSNVTRVSVLNRLISGYVFEDSDYSGLNEGESTLSDIAVELYKLNNSEFTPENANNPAAFISENDELVKESVTNSDGYYIFDELKAGNYYVKYKIDCNKYTVTEKNKTNGEIDTRNIDSDGNMINGNDKASCYAVSNIQVLNSDKIEATNIDLGLRLRQEFQIKMNKYITNVTVTTATGTQSYDYDKATKVKIDVKNPKTATFRVSYLIEIENTKYFPGTIGNIIESIPEGMTFNPDLQENYGWYESEGYLYYMNLSKTLIMPGEKYYMTIVLDLTTETGGDYVNFVSASDLEIQPVTTNFVEPDEIDIEDTDDVISDDTEEGGNE